MKRLSLQFTVRTTVYCANAVLVVDATSIENVIVEGMFEDVGIALAVATTWMLIVPPDAARVTEEPAACVREPLVTIIWLLDGLTKEMVVVSRPMLDVWEAVVARLTFQVTLAALLMLRT